ncbi:GNAT family N-acetyltransferase [Labrys neptuniae]
MSAIEISDLRDQPHFLDVVADRVWRAWWQEQGESLETVSSLFAENLTATGTLPACLVAHRGNDFVGTASLIASDLEERPALTPWVAAVWIEPEFRRQGHGAAVVAAVAELAFRRGFGQAYLCAEVDKRSFYAGLGWRLMEENIGPFALDVFEKRAPAR